MPRPKELEDSVVVPIVLTRKLKLRASEAAKKLGFPSLSALIRAALEEYISSRLKEASAAPSAINPDPPQADPLEEMEWQSFLKAVDRLERDVDKYLELIRRFGVREEGQPLVLLSGGRREEVYMPSVGKLFSRWNTLKRWYKSLKRREYGVSRRLVDIHEKIKEYGRLRGELPPDA